MLELDNGASLDFLEDDGEIAAHHETFLVGDNDFDAICRRLRDHERPFWADPFRQRRPSEVNATDGGRGLSWDGPDGHCPEIITRPYGTGGNP